MNLSTESRGQSQLDFVIGAIILITFISTTLLAGVSPLVNEDSSNVYLQTESEQALIQLIDNELTDDNGEYNTTKIERLNSTDNPSFNVDVGDNIDMSVNVIAISENNKPSIFDTGESRLQIGKSPPNIGTNTASRGATIDGRPIRVEVTVWRDV